MNDNFTNKLIKHINDEINELKEYTQDNNYSELEKHDCQIAINTFTSILQFLCKEESLNLTEEEEFEVTI